MSRTIERIIIIATFLLIAPVTGTASGDRCIERALYVKEMANLDPGSKHVSGTERLVLGDKHSYHSSIEGTSTIELSPSQYKAHLSQYASPDGVVTSRSCSNNE